MFPVRIKHTCVDLQFTKVPSGAGGTKKYGILNILCQMVREITNVGRSELKPRGLIQGRPHPQRRDGRRRDSDTICP